MNSSVRSDRPVPGATNGMRFAGANARSSGREIGPVQHRAIPGQRSPPSGLPRGSVTTECAVVGHFLDRPPAERRRGGKVQARWGAPDRTRDRANSVATAPVDRTFVLPDAPLVRVGFRPGMVSVGPKDLNRGENPREGRPRGEIAVLSPSTLAIPISTIVRVVLRSSTRPPWAVPYVRAVDRFGIRSPHRHPYRFPLWLPR
jgi:hypothetical protein